MKYVWDRVLYHLLRNENALFHINGFSKQLMESIVEL